MHVVKKNFWDEPYMYRSYDDGIIRLCVPVVKMSSVLEACHSSHVRGTLVWILFADHLLKLA